jgi:hypothetical protein
MPTMSRRVAGDHFSGTHEGGIRAFERVANRPDRPKISTIRRRMFMLLQSLDASVTAVSSHKMTARARSTGELQQGTN